jgi:MFS family permease
MLLQGVFLSFGVFLDPLIHEFGWSNATTSATYSIYWITMSYSGLVMGSLADRHSPRIILGLSGFLVGLGMVLSSHVTQVWQLYLSFGIIGGIGAGGLWIPATSTVMRWFNEGRSLDLAVSVVSTGVGVGTLIMAPLAGYSIALFGWRQGYLLIGILAWGMTALAAALIRIPKATPRGKSTLSLSDSIREIVRSRTFWILLLAYGLGVGIARQDVMVHLASFLAGKQGFAYSTGALSLAVVGAGSILGRLSFGGLASKIGENRILPFCFLLQGLSTILFVLSQDVLSTYLLSLVFGMAYGGSVPQFPLILRKRFGMRYFGAAFGLLLSGAGIGAVIGPTLIGGHMYDLTNSYLLSFLADGSISLTAAGLGSLLVFSLGNRSRPLQAKSA